MTTKGHLVISLQMMRRKVFLVDTRRASPEVIAHSLAKS